MREDLLKEIELEYDQIRFANEREEQRRREQIMTEQPEIYALVQEREELIFGTLRNILKGPSETGDLAGRMEKLSIGIRSRLEEKGFPADYLAPVYRCPICRDTGRTGEPVKEPCACLKKAYHPSVFFRPAGCAGGLCGRSEFPDWRSPGKALHHHGPAGAHLF